MPTVSSGHSPSSPFHGHSRSLPVGEELALEELVVFVLIVDVVCAVVLMDVVGRVEVGETREVVVCEVVLRRDVEVDDMDIPGAVDVWEVDLRLLFKDDGLVLAREVPGGEPVLAREVVVCVVVFESVDEGELEGLAEVPVDTDNCALPVEEVEALEELE